MSSPQMTTMFGLLDACACAAAGMATAATRVMRTRARKIARLDFIDTSISPLVNVGRRRMTNLSSGLGLRDIVLWCNAGASGCDASRHLVSVDRVAPKCTLRLARRLGKGFLGELQPTVVDNKRARRLENEQNVGRRGQIVRLAMERSATRPSGRRYGAVVLMAAWTFASACVSMAPPQRSGLQEKIGQGSLSASELRLRLYELPEKFGGTIETAADRIRVESSDPAVRRRALLWKADGIPALYSAALRPDPLAGALDVWLLLEQMSLYFSEGAGKDAFGEQQPIATAAVAKILAIVEEGTASLTSDRQMFERRAAAIRRFARAHPIEGSFSSRDTAQAELARLSQAE